MLVDADRPLAGIVLVTRGLLAVETRAGTEERGPGEVVGRLERLDGTDTVRVVAKTAARVVLVDPAAWAAAEFG